MPQLISAPTVIPAAGNKPKVIEEFVGRVNSGDAAVSIARMRSPAGWVEPFQTPEFDEYTVVLAGSLRVESNGEVLAFYFNRAFHAKKSLHYFQGQYGAAVPLPDCLRGTAGIVRTDVFQCLNFVESLVKAVK